MGNSLTANCYESCYGEEEGDNDYISPSPGARSSMFGRPATDSALKEHRRLLDVTKDDEVAEAEAETETEAEAEVEVEVKAEVDALEVREAVVRGAVESEAEAGVCEEQKGDEVEEAFLDAIEEGEEVAEGSREKAVGREAKDVTEDLITLQGPPALQRRRDPVVVASPPARRADAARADASSSAVEDALVALPAARAFLSELGLELAALKRNRGQGLTCDKLTSSHEWKQRLVTAGICSKAKAKPSSGSGTGSVKVVLSWKATNAMQQVGAVMSRWSPIGSTKKTKSGVDLATLIRVERFQGNRTRSPAADAESALTLHFTSKSARNCLSLRFASSFERERAFRGFAAVAALALAGRLAWAWNQQRGRSDGSNAVGERKAVSATAVATAGGKPRWLETSGGDAQEDHSVAAGATATA